MLAEMLNLNRKIHGLKNLTLNLNAEGDTITQSMAAAYLKDAEPIGHDHSIVILIAPHLSTFSMPLCRLLHDRILDMISGVVNNFADLCDIEGVLHATAGPADFSGKSVREIVNLLVDVGKMPMTRKAGIAAFGVASKDSQKDPDLPSKAALDLMSKFVESTELMHLDLPAGLVTGDVVKFQAEELIAMLLLHEHVNQIASVLLMFAVEMTSPEHCINKHVLVESYQSAIQFADMKLKAIDSNLQTHAKMYVSAGMNNLQWGMGVPAIKSWTKSVAAILIELATRFYKQCCVDLEELTLAVEKHTLSFDHFCNDKQFIVNLVKKHLLVGKSAFNNEVVCLFHRMNQLGQVSKQFGLTDPRNDPLVKYAMEHASAVYMAGKKAVTVTVACDCILNMSGQNQVQEATALFEKRGDILPASVMNKLRPIVANKGGCTDKV